MLNQLDNFNLLNHVISGKTQLSSTEKLVAITLLSHRNNISMKCCPGLPLIIRETGFSRRTVQRAIKELINKTEIVKYQVKRGDEVVKSQYYFMHDIEVAKGLYRDMDSIFMTHHGSEVEHFENCLISGMFEKTGGGVIVPPGGVIVPPGGVIVPPGGAS